ncbi:MAG: aminotransferase class IV [Lentisphaerae bacterium]|nr:aminotransferase class IV [Lentisphaerota bacterium]
MKKIELSSFSEIANDLRKPFHRNYYAMYSSVYDGIVTDPVLMTVPVDDHIVHRGDGVFETLKCVNGSIYNMAAHLDRLAHGVATLYHKPCFNMSDIPEITMETVRAGNHRDCLIKIIVSRGSGSMGVSPYDTDGSQLYIVASKLGVPFMESHPEGAVVAVSSIMPKESMFARTKSCNYLPNVLAQKQALDAGAHFAAMFDEKDHLAEGATENMAIITADAALVFPMRDRILTGTTMIRVIELAAELVDSGDLSDVRQGDITRGNILAAAEMLIIGTSCDVTAVRAFDGHAIGSICPGPICGKLNGLLQRDIRENPAIRTFVFE